ncbi:MAG TPA: hypothetical protein PLO62_12625, partial [Candidatus Hydrogenedentes bacterium]|nr:hypothetical protein [Candidatus Hydrogenedentota bacterium]
PGAIYGIITDDPSHAPFVRFLDAMPLLPGGFATLNYGMYHVQRMDRPVCILQSEARKTGD